MDMTITIEHKPGITLIHLESTCYIANFVITGGAIPFGYLEAWVDNRKKLHPGIVVQDLHYLKKKLEEDGLTIMRGNDAKDAWGIS